MTAIDILNLSICVMIVILGCFYWFIIKGRQKIVLGTMSVSALLGYHIATGKISRLLVPEVELTILLIVVMALMIVVMAQNVEITKLKKREIE